MNAQPSRWDAREGVRRRDAGIARASSAHAAWLAEARHVAVQIARISGTVTADDLRSWGIETPEGASPNIFGAVFSGDRRFVAVGYMYSARPEAHRNLLRVWRLA